jgi:hypothetical protein
MSARGRARSFASRGRYNQAGRRAPVVHAARTPPRIRPVPARAGSTDDSFGAQLGAIVGTKETLQTELQRLDGKSYGAYKSLKGTLARSLLIAIIQGYGNLIISSCLWIGYRRILMRRRQGQGSKFINQLRGFLASGMKGNQGRS